MQADPVVAVVAPEIGEGGAERTVGPTSARGRCRAGRCVGTGRAHEVAEQQDGGLVGPLEVVQHEQDRCRRRRVVEDDRHRLEEPVALGGGIVGGLGRHGHDKALGQLGQQSGQLRGLERELAAERLDRHAHDVRPDRLDERLVRHQRLLVAVAVEDDALPCRSLGDLSREPRLADAGLADDEGELPHAPSPRTPPEVEQAAALLGAVDEGGLFVAEQGGRHRHRAGHRRPTEQADTGSPSPFTANGVSSPNSKFDSAPTSTRARSDAMICPPDAESHRRWATTTGVPK